MLTPEQRESLDLLLKHGAPLWHSEDWTPTRLHRLITTALADLDACRAALAPVADRIREVQATGRMPEYYAAPMYRDEAAAVLAAAGEEQT